MLHKIFRRENFSLKNCGYLLFFIYFVFHVLTLTRFPFMHSDESWLSGLSRNILDTGSYASTEAFFDLKTRYPHAIKILFHSLQVLFIRFFGYSLFNMRFISLIFGMLALFHFHKLSKKVLSSTTLAWMTTVLFAVDIQFIYASHFARQEIILLWILIYSLYFFLSGIKNPTFSRDILLGSIIGLSIGIHPNSFIISLPIGCIYLFHIYGTSKLTIKNLMLYGSTVALFALGFILLSKSFDPHFIQHYLSYGQSEFEVLSPITSKIKQVKFFYLKLFYGISGTYYTPNIKFQFILFLVSVILVILKLFAAKNHADRQSITAVILSIIGINIGIILIGRYNQTSIIFIFPLFYVLIGSLLGSLPKPYKNIVFGFLLVFLVANTGIQMQPYLDNHYQRYLQGIEKGVDKDKEVLANLNTEYYFNNGKLHDYRNLAFLRDHGMSFSEYIHINNIEYIVYPEEMDFIYRSRPIWNGIYGNLLYYEDMQAFLNEHCELVHEFQAPIYGMRIVRYVDDKPWKIKIYKVY
ncbi:MAG: ArnT family glycosyltransferase [Bacillota bacterium]